MSSSLIERVAAGPISWGICEVPGWGLQLAPDRVLGEMHELGVRATESGPEGYLGDDGPSVRTLLDAHGLQLVGGFLAVVLHDRAYHEASLERVRRTARLFAAAGGEILCSAVVADDDWSPRFALSDEQWANVAHGLELVDEAATGEGIRHVLHPHWRTLVEQDEDVQRVLELSDVGLCLDTGHLTLGGCDPAELARTNADRIGHVHLKDVRAAIAEVVRAGQISYTHAVGAGMYVPLGDGDVDVPALVRELTLAGYPGWYVLEQDTALSGDSTAEDDRPRRDVARSLAHLTAALP